MKSNAIFTCFFCTLIMWTCLPTSANGDTDDPRESEVKAITSKGSAYLYGHMEMLDNSPFYSRYIFAYPNDINGKTNKESCHYGFLNLSSRWIPFELKPGVNRVKIMGQYIGNSGTISQSVTSITINAVPHNGYITQIRRTPGGFVVWVETAVTHQIISDQVDSEGNIISHYIDPMVQAPKPRVSPPAAEIIQTMVSEALTHSNQTSDSGMESVVNAPENKTRVQVVLQAETYLQIVADGKTDLENGNVAAAYRDAVIAIAQNPKEFQAYALAGFALERKGDLPAALKMIDEAITHAPDDKRAAMMAYKEKIQKKSPADRGAGK